MTDEHVRFKDNNDVTRPKDKFACTKDHYFNFSSYRGLTKAKHKEGEHKDGDHMWEFEK